jgi:hypothetical protein
MQPDEPLRRVRFHWRDLPEQLAAFAGRWPAAVADARGHAFVVTAAPARLQLPLVVLRPAPGERIADFVARVDAADVLQVVLLVRAGAVALGAWQDGELIVHKALRKYVVRGNGRAQATHLKTRGKSRYGSRLRLQNWRALLAETNERLRDLWQQHGPPARVFWSAPVRVWADLHAAVPPPPFARDDPALQRLPLHVHRPDFDELLRVRVWLEHGCLELPR